MCDENSNGNDVTLVSPSVCVCGTPLRMVDVQIQATTGNIYNLHVAATDTVDYIRRVIAKKTKLSKDRILLLYKDRYGYSYAVGVWVHWDTGNYGTQPNVHLVINWHIFYVS